MSFRAGATSLMHNVNALLQSRSQSPSSSPRRPPPPPIVIPPPLASVRPLTAFEFLFRNRYIVRTPSEIPQRRQPPPPSIAIPSSSSSSSSPSPSPPPSPPPSSPPPSSSSSSSSSSVVGKPPSADDDTISLYECFMQKLANLDLKKAKRVVCGSLVALSILLSVVSSYKKLAPHLQGQERKKRASELYRLALSTNKEDVLNSKNISNILPLMNIIFKKSESDLQKFQAAVSVSNLMTDFLNRKKDEHKEADIKEMKQLFKELMHQLNLLTIDKSLITLADIKDKTFIYGERVVTGYFFLPEDTKGAEDVKVSLMEDHEWMIINPNSGKDIKIKIPPMVYTKPSAIQAIFCVEPGSPRLMVVFKKILKRRTPKKIVRKGGFFVPVRNSQSDNCWVTVKKADDKWVDSEVKSAKEKESSEVWRMFSSFLDEED